MILLWFFYSLCVLAGSGLLALALACPVALAWSKFPGRSSWLSQCLVTGCLFVPLYVQAGGWMAGFGVLGWFTITQVSASQFTLHGLVAVIGIHGVGAFPVLAWLLYLGLQRVPRSLEESALSDGGFMHLLRAAWGPALLRWGILGWLVAAASVAGDMLITNLYRLPTLTERCYLAIAAGEREWGTWLGSCLPAFTLSIVPLWLLRTHDLLFDQSASRESLTHSNHQTFSRFPWASNLLRCMMWIITLGAVLLPIANLVVKAGWDPHQVDGLVERSWSWNQWMKSITNLSEYRQEMYWSLLLSVSAASTALGIGWWSSRAAVPYPKIRMLLLALGLFALALPGPVISFTIKRSLESLPIAMADALLDRSLVAPVLALQFRLFPLLAFPLLLVRFRWLQSDGDLMAIDGLKGWALEKRFLFGNIHVVIAIFLLGMAVAVSELASYLLLLPAGVCPLAMRIFELLHYGVRYKEAGLCLFLAFIGMTTGWLVRWLVLYRPFGR